LNQNSHAPNFVSWKKSVGLICATSNQGIKNLYLIFQLPRRHVYLLESQISQSRIIETLNDIINRELIEGGSNLALYGIWNIVLWIFNMHNAYSDDTGNALSEHGQFQL
jgi:hypothetical protein